MNISRVSFGELYVRIPDHSVSKFEEIGKFLKEQRVAVEEQKRPVPIPNGNKYYKISSKRRNEIRIRNILRKYGIKVSDPNEPKVGDKLNESKVASIIKELNKVIRR